MPPTPGRFEVVMTHGAARDLEAIDHYLCHHDSVASAERVLKRLVAALEQLERLPDRGPHPRELLALGIREFRQLVVKPYRLIYRVEGKTVIVHLVADARRDFQSLLARRLLGD